MKGNIAVNLLTLNYSFDFVFRDEVRSKPSYLLRFTAGAKYASTLSIASKHLAATCPHEVKEWLTLLLSQKFYCRNKRGFWYDQLAMIETKYVKNYEQVR